MSKPVGLRLDPLDTLFFRDGRPFGAATRASSGQPLPQTLAGAVGTALLQKYGCDFAALAAALQQRRGPGGAAELEQAVARAGGPPWVARLRVRGPWLARTLEGNGLDVLVPAPAILHRVKGGRGSADQRVYRLAPASADLPGWRESCLPDQQGLRPLWLRHAEPTEAAGGYLAGAGLRCFLAGSADLAAEHLVRPDDLFGFDHRTGIEINADRLTAKEGSIYGASFLALRPAVRLYAEVELPDDAPAGAEAFAHIPTLAFGGEGKRVAVVAKVPPVFAGLDRTPSAPGEKPLLLLTTPGLFRDGWRPGCLRDRLAAAAVPGAVAVSGWDLARNGPKPTRFAAAAGSVYFLKDPLDAWPPSLCDDPGDGRQGWGCYVKGVWIDEAK
jgi:CRISPR-associated protein Cmr3